MSVQNHNHKRCFVKVIYWLLLPPSQTRELKVKCL